MKNKPARAVSKDTERLDWLERTDMEQPYRLVDERWWWSYKTNPKPTLRLAIDAAMRQERRGRKP